MPSSSRLADHPTAAAGVAAAAGFAGSALIARASYVIGTVAGHNLPRHVQMGPYRLTYEIGICLLALAWVGLGRLVLDDAIPGMTKRVVWSSAVMVLPLLASAPVTSQDVWGYLGQANIAVHGLDPYSVGPAAVPGPFADAVTHEYLHLSSPYGPLWIWICRIIVQVAQPHVWAAMYGVRLVAVAGMVLIGVALVRLCRVTGARPPVALWLALTGPLPVLMLVGAMHNDALMLGLALTGVALTATTRSMWRALLLGGVLVGLAAAVKIVALVIAPFLPLVWFWYAGSHRDGERTAPGFVHWVGLGTACVVAAAASLAGAGYVLGFGVGWLSTIRDGAVGVQWMSLTQQIANVAHLVAPDRVAAHQGDRYGFTRPLSKALLVALLGIVTLTARRRPPLRTLALVFLVIVVTSTAARTWYLMWPLVFVAAVPLPRRVLVAVAAASATVALWYPPGVRPPVPVWVLLALFVPLVALIGWTARSAGPGEGAAPSTA